MIGNRMILQSNVNRKPVLLLLSLLVVLFGRPLTAAAMLASDPISQESSGTDSQGPETSGAGLSEAEQGWSTAVQLSREPWAWFPVAAADPAGGVHVLWAETQGPNPAVEKSDALVYTRWDGTVWSPPVDVLLSPGNASTMYPSMAADNYGYLHVTWSGEELYYSHVQADRAGEPGEWMTPVALSENRVFQSAIATDDMGGVHIAYPDGVTGLYYLYSDNGGRTWSRSLPVWLVTDAQSGVRDVSLDVDARQVIHLAWTKVQLPEGYPPLGAYYMRSNDFGETWTAPLEVAGKGYGESNVLVDGDTVHLVWHGRAGVGGTFYQSSADGGATWSSPARLLEGAGMTRAPAMQVDSAGTLHLAAISGDGLSYTYRTPDGWADPAVLDKTVQPGYEPHYPTLVLANGNRLFLFWGSQGDAEGTGAVRYAGRQTSAPYVEPQPIATVAPAATAGTAQTSTWASPSVPAGQSPAPATPTRWAPAGATPAPAANSSLGLVAGVVPAVLIIGLVFILKMMAAGRR